MRFPKINKKIIISICVIATWFLNFTYVYAVSDLNFEEFIPNKIQQVTDGANVEVSSSETDGYVLDINMSTKGLPELRKGYYIPYIYENQKRDWSNYQAMSFYVVNESDSSVKINFNAKRIDGKVVSISNDNGILIKNENSEFIERVCPSYGTVEIPGNFKGTLYIPFDNFNEENNNKSLKISSWGIVAVLGQNEEKKLKLSKFSFVNKDSNMATLFDCNFSIKGDNTVGIPVVGQATSDYKIETINQKGTSNTNDVQFKLMKSVDGVTISDNGHLTVNPDVEAQKIQICAVLNNSMSEMMEIELLKSWTVSNKEVDGTSKSIPKPDEMSELIEGNENLLLSSTVLIRIQMGVVLIAFTFGILYCYWNRKNTGKHAK